MLEIASHRIPTQLATAPDPHGTTVLRTKPARHLSPMPFSTLKSMPQGLVYIQMGKKSARDGV